ncbi:MAG: 2-methylaconitate cis-trans-isomerase PrpF, partial [Sulfurimonas sp.]|uniref:PrpF domain-containing protein n=1 Tax=Sulfurimonas sp. TaxID=2022749 RepID=UPI0039E32EE8
MSYTPQQAIPATYMRGGTSKGVFFKKDDLPKEALADQAKLDKLLLRVIGSPDPYNKQIDGLGNASSSTSKTVIVSKSTKEDHDVDYRFGQIAIDKPFVDWSGNCGNLTGAVGSFAIKSGFIDKNRLVEDGIIEVRIWQVNIQKTIIAHVPMAGGVVREMGDFILDGVAFPAAEVKIEFVAPIDPGEALFPTGN